MAVSAGRDPYNSLDWTTPWGGISPPITKSAAEEAAMWRRRWLVGVSTKSILISQWVKFDRAYQGEFLEGSRPSWRPDVSLNYIFESIEDHRSQISAMRLEPMLKPIVPVPQNRLSLIQSIVKFLYSNKFRMPILLDLANLYTLLYGTAIWRIGWNPDSRPENMDAYDRVIGVDRDREDFEPFRRPDGTPILGPEGTPITSALFKGDVDVTIRHPANFFVQPGAYDLQTARWCMEADPVPVEQLEEEYPSIRGKISRDMTFMYTEPFYRPTVLQTTPTGDSGYAYRLLCWEKHPKRGLIKRVVIGQTVVDEQDHFYEDGHYPYVIQRYFQVAKQFWGMSIVQQIYNLNRAINKLVELIMMNGMLTANSQKILHVASGIPPLSITNEPGKVYPTNFDPSATLVPVKNEPVPQYVFEIIAVAKTALSEVAGRFSAPPAGIRAAAAIISLLERMSARTRREAEVGPAESLRQVTSLVLHRMRQFYTETRLFPFRTDVGSIQFEAVRLADILKMMDFVVEIEAVAGQPISKALTVEKLTAFTRMHPGALKPSESAELLELPLHLIERLRGEETKQEAVQSMMAGIPGQAMPPGAPGMPPPPEGGEEKPAEGPPANFNSAATAGRVQVTPSLPTGMGSSILGSPGPAQHILNAMPDVARSQ